jgi:Cd2+/Zn2+-exporting ATPase
MSKICCSTDDSLNLVNKKEHKHKYDTQGNQLCCLKTEKICKNAGASDLLKDANHSDDGHGHTGGKSCSKADTKHCDDEYNHIEKSGHNHDHHGHSHGDDHDHSHDIEGKTP